MRVKVPHTLVGVATAAFVLSVLTSATAAAATHAVLGKSIQITDASGDAARRRVVGSALERRSDAAVVGDPTSSGATLTVTANGADSSSQSVELPASGWSAKGSTGFRWSNRGETGNPVRSASIRRTGNGTMQIKVELDGRDGALDIVPPDPGTDGGFVLTIGDGDSYCVGFGGAAGGTVARNDEKQWTVRRPTTAACPDTFAGTFDLRVLSNRADLVSSGDALVEVVLPEGVDPSEVEVAVDGTDVTGMFALRSNGRFMGLVTDLPLGPNDITASVRGATRTLTITNHPHGGPVIAGPQLQPWVCQDTAVDEQCNEPPSYRFVYKSTDTTKTGLQPYDPANPPTDVAHTTTDEGVTVPFIVRVENGYQDRDQYEMSVLYQPGQEWTPWEPQPQWNHKLLILHGASCGVEYQTGTAPGTTGGGTVADTSAAAEYALGRGYATMSTALDNSGHNCNIALQAESLIMAKERLVEQLGELRYSIGSGCSGGSLAIQWIANAYPGVYQGILPACSFPDAWSTATQFLDYHLTLAYFLDPSKWGPGIVWSPTQMADVQGHISIVNSQVSDTAQFHVAVPTDPCGGVSEQERYHPETNPGGVRCSIQDAAINVFGPRPADLWSANEQLLGRGFAGTPIDNVGVQYGLSALQQAKITPVQFLDLNEKIGGLDVDTNLIPERVAAPAQALANAYRSGMINTANNLDEAAIIDCRGPDPGAFHDAYRAYAVRARLDREHGTHANQLIWEGPVALFGDAMCARNSLIAMDQWLAAVEQDSSDKPLAQKIIDNRPADLTDRCYDGAGNKLLDDICGQAIVTTFGTPRMVAGDALTTDTNKCRLRPLDRNDDYGPIPFTEEQWERMETLFAGGVCDFSQAGVEQQSTVPWQTYQDDAAGGAVIYGGRPLGEAPVAR